MKQNDATAATAIELEKFFREANVRVEELDAAKSHRAKAIRIGQFLSPLVGREVPIEAHGRTGTATLRVREGRSREKQYWAEVRWLASEPGDIKPPKPKDQTPATTMKAMPGPQHPKRKAMQNVSGVAMATKPTPAADAKRSKARKSPTDEAPAAVTGTNAGKQEVPKAKVSRPTPVVPTGGGNSEAW